MFPVILDAFLVWGLVFLCMPWHSLFHSDGPERMAELCFIVLVASQRKSVRRARDPEQGILAWVAGSGVSQQRFLILGPRRMQGFEQKPWDGSRVTVGTGSKWKDQPWGHRLTSTVAGSSDHTWAAMCTGPGRHSAFLQTPSMLPVCIPLRHENYYSSSRGYTLASLVHLCFLQSERTTSLSNTSGIWGKI